MPASHADVILLDASIVTMDADRPAAGAIAVGGGRILAVGSDADVEPLRGAGTRTRSLQGAVVLPGLHDVHAHHALAGHAALSELTLPPGASLDDVIQAVADQAARDDDDSWIAGGNWAGRLRAEIGETDAIRRLDAVSGRHPVILRDASQHNRWANSIALERGGIDATTPDPSDGSIGRHPDGRPTGILIESAGLLVERARGSGPSDEVADAASRHGIGVLNSYGISAFQDAGMSLPILRALHRLDARGELDAWVVASLLANDPIFGADPVGEELMVAAAPYRSEHVRPDFVKVFLDGVPSTRTAAFVQPYLADEAGIAARGATLFDAPGLAALLRTAAGHGLSAKIHCTGDAAVQVALDAIERVPEGERPPAPYQIAHGQFVQPADLERFAELGVVADASPPLWFPGPITAIVDQVHPAPRGGHAQPNRSLLTAGARIAAGSDWPVSDSPDPWIGMQGLITRADPTGRFPGTISPEEALTPHEALAAYTSWSATAMGLEGITGVIRAGASADLVIVDRDPTGIDPETIAATRVHETWFAGRPVYESA